jgi:uncharacterized membrane protein YkoI
MADRRVFLIAMLLGLLGQGPADAFAKDGEGGGGDGGGGDGGGGGGGNDDGGGDDGGDDGGGDDSDDDGSGRGGGNSNRGRGKNDGDRIRSAVRDGRAEPLRKILSAVRKRYDGQVISIRLTGKNDNLLYRIRMIDRSDKLIEVQVNAKTSRILGATGF